MIDNKLLWYLYSKDFVRFVRFASILSEYFEQSLSQCGKENYYTRDDQELHVLFMKVLGCPLWQCGLALDDDNVRIFHVFEMQIGMNLIIAF